MALYELCSRGQLRAEYKQRDLEENSYGYFFHSYQKQKKKVRHLECFILPMPSKWKAQHSKMQNNRTMQSAWVKFKLQCTLSATGKPPLKQVVYDKNQSLSKEHISKKFSQSVTVTDSALNTRFWMVEKETMSAPQKSNGALNTLK